MRVLLDTDAGPLEGYTQARFQVALSDVGSGSVQGDPTIVGDLDGATVRCRVDGAEVARWTVEDADARSDDHDETVWSGRGLASRIERAVVLPAGYPSHTVRQREMSGHPLAIWLTLLGEAQGRGRLGWLTPSFTASQDSRGQPWTSTFDVELEPGVNLLELLGEMCTVEGAEWLLRPDGTLDVAGQVGQDRSGEVVLFVGRDQIGRGRRQSSRHMRDTVYVESSTGVSEGANASGAGEIWLEAQDFAAGTSRQQVADKLAGRLGEPDVEVEVRVSADCGIFDAFQVGDLVGLDQGGTVEPVRVVAATVTVADQPEVELTLMSAVELRQRKIDRAVEAKADVRLAADVSLQRRHGLVRADRIEAGSLRVDSYVESANFVAGSSGWRIRGDGSAEFNGVVVRGTIVAHSGLIGGWTIQADRLSGNGRIVGGTIEGTTVAGDGLVLGDGSAGFVGGIGFFAGSASGFWLGSGPIFSEGLFMSGGGPRLVGNQVLRLHGERVTTEIFQGRGVGIEFIELSNVPNLRPLTHEGANLGNSARRWGTLWCVTVNQSSDAAGKHIDGRAPGLGLIRRLEPVAFRRRQSPERTEWGLVAQQVADVAPGLVDGDEGGLGLRYTGLIGPLIAAVQELDAKVEALGGG